MKYVPYRYSVNSAIFLLSQIGLTDSNSLRRQSNFEVCQLKPKLKSHFRNFFDGMTSLTIHENHIPSRFCASCSSNIIKYLCVHDSSQLTYKGKWFVENNDLVLQMHILENYMKPYGQNAKKNDHRCGG